ncbi:hypothetical protein M569_04213, partial [Genlisea aurea]
MSHREALRALLPTDPFDLECGLSLIPRVKLNISVFRGDKTVSSVDEWKLKRSIIDYLKSKHSVSIPEEDIKIFKYKDLKKRKREDPVAHGCLFLLDLGFLSKKLASSVGDEADKAFVQWRSGILSDMDAIELNLEGVKFRLNVALAKGDDYAAMRKAWEETAAFGTRAFPRGESQRADTIILKGVPSRWFAEPRVSSKPSMLVTHTIFSAFGKIRNLDVGEDSGIGDEDGDDIVSGLHCKIVVQFESHRDFCDALKALCGRSLLKQGSRMRSDYELSWDEDGFFRNIRGRADEIKRVVLSAEGNHHRIDSRRKRFR